jgi:hypothetical protein
MQRAIGGDKRRFERQWIEPTTGPQLKRPKEASPLSLQLPDDFAPAISERWEISLIPLTSFARVLGFLFFPIFFFLSSLNEGLFKQAVPVHIFNITIFYLLRLYAFYFFPSHWVRCLCACGVT